jgi:hypothetical protein
MLSDEWVDSQTSTDGERRKTSIYLSYSYSSNLFISTTSTRPSRSSLLTIVEMHQDKGKSKATKNALRGKKETVSI